MKTLSVWKPLKEIERINGDLRDSFFGTPEPAQPNEAVTFWMPSADIIEDESEYSIVLELPGFKKSDFDVRVEDGWLNISGERPQPTDKEGRTYNRIERAVGPFKREFRVPKDADADHISAIYRDGLLCVQLPRLEHAKPRKIAVKIG